MDQYWLEVAVDTTPECLDDLAAYLTGCGIVGLVLESEADFDRQLEEGRPYWDDVERGTRARLAGDLPGQVLRDPGRGRRSPAGGSAVRPGGLPGPGGQGRRYPGRHHRLPPGGGLGGELEAVLSALPGGDRLYVVPEWMRGEALPEGRTPLYLNPGLIFGTGSHGTTRLCLEGVERYVEPGDRVLDLGTGSGILAIAALLLGAREAVGCDIDPKAARVAAENASYNGVEESFRVYTGDVNRDQKLKQALAGQYQLVLANIIADVIIPLAAVAGDYLAPGGRFLTSGIIESRAADVAAALTANGFVIVETRTREGWVSYTAQREV